MFQDDVQHEGHRGYVIDEIREASNLGISSGPNIVLLHAGTNDIHRDIDGGRVEDAVQRLKRLADLLLERPHGRALSL
jgi:hypothetical protein